MKIFFLEDQTLFRDLIVKALTHALDVTVLGAYATVAEVTERLPVIRNADVGLLDVRLGSGDAFELLPVFREHAPRVRLMWVTSVFEDVLLQRALDANLPGFIHKSDPLEELMTAVQRVAAGQTFMSTSVRQYRDALRNRSDLYSKVLSMREQEILKLIGGGFSNEEAAAMLGISAQTVKTHRRNIMARLDLHSATELQAYAVRNGFVTPDALR